MAVLAATTLLACGAPEAPSRRILPNDNRIPAGQQRSGSLSLKLEVRQGDWYPESDTGLSEPILAFAEAGKPLQIPGPLVRVPIGTTIHASIQNRSTVSLVLHGFAARPATDSILLPADSSVTLSFNPGAAGTYYYWAGPTDSSMSSRPPVTTQLSGALIVDSVGARTDDRIFVLGEWNQPPDSSGPPPIVPRDLMTINGKMWPYTERFSYTEGDSVHWRWVNTSKANHPMHLHGFYYDVLSHGDGAGDTVLTPAHRRTVVTETMLPGTTMSIAWQAARAGNWLFHCHFAFHVSHFLSLTKVPDPEDVGGPHAMDHSPHMMAGLVLGIQVKAKPGSAAVVASSAVRHIRITARELKLGPGQEEEYHYYVQGDGIAPADSANSNLVLQRGVPARITIVNRLRAPTTIHWHGIELTDSYADGVPDWSGSTGHVAPAIAPGDSFTVQFTPPRSGTFMYHSHWNEIHQIAHGLYGALLVTDGPGVDTTRERLFLVGGNEGGGRFNRIEKPKPTRITAGQLYRFRVVNIHGGSLIVFSLMADSTLLDWRPIAKDGADLAPEQAKTRPARAVMGPGEIADFEVMVPRAGKLRLDAKSPVEGWEASAPIVVRD